VAAEQQLSPLEELDISFQLRASELLFVFHDQSISLAWSYLKRDCWEWLRTISEDLKRIASDLVQMALMDIQHERSSRIHATVAPLMMALEQSHSIVRLQSRSQSDKGTATTRFLNNHQTTRNKTNKAITSSARNAATAGDVLGSSEASCGRLNVGARRATGTNSSYNHTKENYAVFTSDPYRLLCGTLRRMTGRRPPRVPATAARPAAGPVFTALVNDRHRIGLSAQHGHHRFDEVGGDNDTESLLTLTGLKGLLKYVNGPRAHGQLRLKFL